MNEYDDEYGIVWAICHNYLMCHYEVTKAQAMLADEMYHHLRKLREKCKLYKNDRLEKPENYLKLKVEE